MVSKGWPVQQRQRFVGEGTHLDIRTWQTAPEVAVDDGYEEVWG